MDLSPVAVYHNSDRFFLKIEDLASHIALEHHHLADHDAVEPVEPGNTVANLQNLTDTGDIDRTLITVDLPLDQIAYLVNIKIHRSLPD